MARQMKLEYPPEETVVKSNQLVRTLFLQNRTQEEIESLDDGEIDELIEDAKASAQESNPGAGESVLASEALRLMERKWTGH